ncbi:MAG: hypothetical protein PUA94_03860, partial [Bacteroidales bacterium]|nr:hypothetical protein [Bacteroidales bacterium]
MTAEESFKKYPYFIHPAIEALKDAEGDERRTLLRRIAAAVGPETALRTLIGVDPEEFRDFYGTAEQPSPDTDSTISQFLDRFDLNPASAAGSDDLPIPVAPPAIDYAAAMLADDATDEMPDDPTADLLSSFLNSAKEPDDAEEAQGNDEPTVDQKDKPAGIQHENEQLSETLARIMII